MKTLFKIAIWIFILLVAGALFLDWFFFSSSIPGVQLNKLQSDKPFDTLASLGKVFQNEMTSLAKQPGKNGLREITISSQELNSLFNIYLAGTMIVENNDQDVKVTGVVFNDGVITADLTFICRIWTPFGNYLNIRLGVVPEIDRNLFKIRFKYIKIGRLELKSIDTLYSKDRREMKLDPKLDMILDAIEKFEVRKDDIMIRYYTDKMQSLLLNNVIAL